MMKGAFAVWRRSKMVNFCSGLDLSCGVALTFFYLITKVVFNNYAFQIFFIPNVNFFNLMFCISHNYNYIGTYYFGVWIKCTSLEDKYLCVSIFPHKKFKFKFKKIESENLLKKFKFLAVESINIDKIDFQPLKKQ